MNKKGNNEITIVLSGEAGQGLQTIELLLIKILKFSGYFIFSTKEYMSRVRGGNNTIEIRISNKKVSAFIDKIDLLIFLNKNAIDRLENRISSSTIIIGDKSHIKKTVFLKSNNIIDIKFTQMAADIGNTLYANSVVIGFICSILNIQKKNSENYIKKKFSGKKSEIIKNNLLALNKGYKEGYSISKSKEFDLNFNIKKNNIVKNKLLINGTESIALGAIAGGCNFISSYPMSPSTGVLVFLSQNSDRFGIITEQAEDEISAINMALGAWYAGARAMVTTSGGGFALMSEGLSLAGITEIPIVIHLAQRPGPATGLPTRTEQGDLELAIYSGHGEFPRIIFAPQSIEDGFYLTQKAFNLADQFQVPVIILTDQYFVDTYYNTGLFDLTKLKNTKHIIKTNENYKRYSLTNNGISPRGIPGYGSGLVAVDSDEHDEEGHITEDMDIRIKMVDKRLKKLKLINKEVLQPELIGAKNYKNLIIGWGSTYHIIKEALNRINNKDTSFLHFNQAYPLYPDLNLYLKKAKKIIIIENNATSQFSKLIKINTGIEIKLKILKYNGLPFSVEELERKINKLI